MKAAMDDRAPALEATNRDLRKRLSLLTTQITDNEAVHDRLRAHELVLLNAVDLAELIDIMIRGTARAFQLSTVTLAIHDPLHEVRPLFAEEVGEGDDSSLIKFATHMTDLSPSYKNLSRPYTGPFHAAAHKLLFPRDVIPASVALLPLRRKGKLIGALNLGTRDRERFTYEHATDFLHSFSCMVAVCAENALNHERLKRATYIDGLTNCYNRRFLQERMQQELARALRNRQSLCCLLFDLDFFKTINDTYGHLAGDQVLVEFAERLRRQLRINDVVARYGGEEFAALLPATAIGDAVKLAERIRQKVREPMMLEYKALNVTVSGGVCEFVPRGQSNDLEKLGEQLLAAADGALYQAKALGRNRVEQAPAVFASND